jgi:hypothetical protein
MAKHRKEIEHVCISVDYLRRFRKYFISELYSCEGHVLGELLLDFDLMKEGSFDIARWYFFAKNYRKHFNNAARHTILTSSEKYKDSRKVQKKKGIKKIPIDYWST